MPRLRKLKFGPRKMPGAGEIHPVTIENTDVTDEQVVVFLRHIGTKLKGRPQKLEESCPADPDGCVASLLRACGIEVRELMSFDQRTLHGRTVNAKFGQSSGGKVEIVEFEPWSEDCHDPDA
jgi:hypothetical protein